MYKTVLALAGNASDDSLLSFVILLPFRCVDVRVRGLSLRVLPLGLVLGGLGPFAGAGGGPVAACLSAVPGSAGGEGRSGGFPFTAGGGGGLDGCGGFFLGGLLFLGLFLGLGVGVTV